MPSRPGTEGRRVRIHYLRPPDRTELFVQELVHDAEDVKVTFARDLRLQKALRNGEEILLEEGSDAVWFTFPGEWHDIGRFHRADGTLTGIYANILTPCRFEPKDEWRTTDLFLDLWIPAREGRFEVGPQPEAEILDLEELEEAEREGWIDGPTAARAREEAARLLEGARRGSWPPPAVRWWTRERARRTLDSG